MSKSFCVAPWISVHAWPDGNVYPCCMANIQNPFGNLNEKSLEEIWNDEKYRQFRLNVKNGIESPDVCYRCYDLEDAGMSNLRTKFENHYQHHEYKIQNTSEDGSAEYTPVYLDIRFSNLCNLKCRTCGPALSFKWGQEENKHIGTNHKIIEVPSHCYDDLVPYLKDVEEIYFAGGESLMTKEHYSILEHLVSIGHFPKLLYNTNCTTFKYKDKHVFDLWKHWGPKKVQLEGSIDGYKEQFNYTRSGANWDDVMENIKAASQLESVNFRVTTVVSIFNVYYLGDLHRHFIESGFLYDPERFNLNLLQEPDEFYVTNLSDETKSIVKDRLNEHYLYLKNMGVSKHCLAHWSNLINVLMTHAPKSTKDEIYYRLYRIDRFRNENFDEVYPELRF